MNRDTTNYPMKAAPLPKPSSRGCPIYPVFLYVYLSSAFSGEVQKRDRKTGNLLATFSGFQTPQDVVEMNDGSVLIAQWSGGNLLQVSGIDGNNRRVVAAGLEGPLGLVSARDGTVFLTESTGGLVSKISVVSGQRKVVTDDLDVPEGIALAPNGKLVVAEVGKRRLMEIDPVSGKKKVLVDNLPIGLKGFAELPETYFPTGVAVSSDGTVYVTSDVENAILRFEGLVQ